MELRHFESRAARRRRDESAFCEAKCGRVPSGGGRFEACFACTAAFVFIAFFPTYANAAVVGILLPSNLRRTCCSHNGRAHAAFFSFAEKRYAAASPPLPRSDEVGTRRVRPARYRRTLFRGVSPAARKNGAFKSRDVKPILRHNRSCTINYHI